MKFHTEPNSFYLNSFTSWVAHLTSLWEVHSILANPPYHTYFTQPN